MDNLNNKKISELKDIARRNKLIGFSYHTKKADLIQFIIDNLSPRPRSPSPRPRSRSLRPRSRSRSPPKIRRIQLDKKVCMTNLKSNIIEVARDYGISVKKSNGKDKTKQELCDALKLVMGGPLAPVIQSKVPVAQKARERSPVAGPSTEPLVPHIIVKQLVNSNDPFTSNELLKRVKKDELVQYATNLGIMKAKAMTKPVILKNIIDIINNRSSSSRSSRSSRSRKSANDLILEAESLIADAEEKIETVDPIESPRDEIRRITEAEEMLADAEEMMEEAVKIDEEIIDNDEEIIDNDEEIIDNDGEIIDDDDEEILSIETPLDFVEEEIVKEDRIAEMVRLRNREIPPERRMYIEQLLEEIQQPEEIISNIAIIQRKVFNCLGLIN